MKACAGGTDVALRGVALAPDHSGVALHQAHDPAEVPLVDDAAVVRRAFGVGAVELLERTGTQFLAFSFFGNSAERERSGGVGQGAMLG